MLQSLLHSQEMGDDDPEQMMRGGGGSRSSRPAYRFQWWHAAAVVLLLFPYISIFVLFGLVSQEKTEKNYYTTETLSVTSSYDTTWSSSYAPGTAVSFNSAGKLKRGAGTSVYDDILADVISATTCPAYASLASVGSGQFVASYAHKADFSSTLLLVSNGQSANEASVLSSVEVDYFIFKIVALPSSSSSSPGLFVAICQDYSNTSETAFVLTGQVKNNAITLNSASAVLYASNFSVDPDLVALSESSFALAYYTNTTLQTTYGTVDLSSLLITLSTSAAFSPNNNYYYFSLAPLTSSSYLLLYFDGDASPSTQTGPLMASVASVDPDSGALAFWNASQALDSQAFGSLASCALSSTTALVMYSSGEGGNNIVVQALEIIGEENNEGETSNRTIVFGGQWQVTTGQSTEGVVDLDIQCGSDGLFQVLYSSLSSSLSLYTALGQYTKGGGIVRLSPSYSLYTPPFSEIEDVTTYSALASSSFSSDLTHTLLFSFTSLASSTPAPTSCPPPLSSSFSSLQRLPQPAGLVSSPSSLTLFGEASPPLSLKAGRVYYANTLGELVQGDYVGQAQGAQEKYLVYNGSCYLSFDSRVGVATDKSTLFVQLPN